MGLHRYEDLNWYVSLKRQDSLSFFESKNTVSDAQKNEKPPFKYRIMWFVDIILSEAIQMIRRKDRTAVAINMNAACAMVAFFFIATAVQSFRLIIHARPGCFK